MKSRFKYFFGLIVFVYLMNNIGIPVYYHYCGGELESVSALFKADGCCGDEEEDEDSDCCKNETKVISQLSESSLNLNAYKLKAIALQLNYLSLNEPSLKIYDFVSTDLKANNNFKIPKPGRSILQDKSILII